MPSVSASQHRLMAASCMGASDAVPKKVACEFMHADKGKVKDMPDRKHSMSEISGRGEKKTKWSELR